MKNKYLYQYLFKLIRSSLLDCDLSKEEFRALNEVEWQNLFDLAQVQGVLAITFESIKRHEPMPVVDDVISGLAVQALQSKRPTSTSCQ